MVESRPQANRHRHQHGWRVGSLFSGIGGLELGLKKAGLLRGAAQLLCENDPGAAHVLRAHPELDHEFFLDDVTKLAPRHLESLDLLTAGFPCQDLSQAGQTEGIGGSRSGLVDAVLRALGRSARRGSGPRWILIENVSFMLRLHKGRAMEHLVEGFESAGYRRWAYRVLDTLGFGLPQRRRRVFFLASRDLEDDPASVLFDGPRARLRDDHVKFEDSDAVGFYWTEGNRGIGWAHEAIPTLKGGSTVGIPSPPAIWKRSSGDFVVPTLELAEQLQGFRHGWTRSASEVLGIRNSSRWRYVGNAVSVPVAQWIGKRLLAERKPRTYDEAPVASPPWPNAACSNVDGVPRAITQSMWPSSLSKRALLSDCLHEENTLPLSHKAAAGFYFRVQRAKKAGRLAPPDEFMDALADYTALCAPERK